MSDRTPQGCCVIYEVVYDIVFAESLLMMQTWTCFGSDVFLCTAAPLWAEVRINVKKMTSRGLPGCSSFFSESKVGECVMIGGGGSTVGQVCKHSHTPPLCPFPLILIPTFLGLENRAIISFQIRVARFKICGSSGSLDSHCWSNVQKPC